MLFDFYLCCRYSGIWHKVRNVDYRSVGCWCACALTMVKLDLFLCLVINRSFFLQAWLLCLPFGNYNQEFNLLVLVKDPCLLAGLNTVHRRSYISTQHCALRNLVICKYRRISSEIYNNIIDRVRYQVRYLVFFSCLETCLQIRRWE